MSENDIIHVKVDRHTAGKENRLATALDENLIFIQTKAARFAERHIGSRPDLHSMSGFPSDIWDKMGKENLLGLSLPMEYEGIGGNYLSMVVAGEALVRWGHNLGITTSWVIHLAVARFLIMGFGNKSQRRIYLNQLATGKITASIAVSEPGIGAHPKYIETSACREGDFYILNGEKTSLTNGPIADLFVVVASTGVEGGRKSFTAFLVPGDTVGLSMTEPMVLDFLRPSPHGGIILSDCSVPATQVLGAEGSAYDEMVKPFREVEDTLMMGPLVGGMEREVELFRNLSVDNGTSFTERLMTDIGELRSILHTLRIIAYEAARMLDSSAQHPEFASLLISFRNLSRQFQDSFEFLVKKAGIKEDKGLRVIVNDLVHSINIGRKISLIKQKKLGEMFFSGKGSDEVAL